MLHVNSNLVFFVYIAIITALCPICERVAKPHLPQVGSRERMADRQGGRPIV